MNRRAPLFAAAGGAALIVLLLLFLVLPKGRSIQEARDKLGQAQTEQDRLQVTLGSLEDAKDNADQYERQIRQLETQIPPLQDQSGFINLTRNIARSAGVDLHDISPGTPQPDVSGAFSVIPVGMTVKGSFFAMVEFLYKLETGPRAAKVVNVSLAGQQVGPAGPVNMTLAIQFYTTDINAGPGSEPGPTAQLPGA